jgi:fumarylacetoacetate (FAA) hydrolase
MRGKRQTGSSGNMADMDWTFAEIIERCAYGCDVLPGDVIGSGTVGTGCFLELNGTGLLNDPNYQPQWLQPKRFGRNGNNRPGYAGQYY